MKILISGATGLIGTALVTSLRQHAHKVVSLSRRGAPSADMIAWNPNTGHLDPASLEGFDAIVHLAGENIGSHRWTTAQKERILESRVKGTRLLSEALARLTAPPKVLISVSGIGFYGNRGDDVLTEESHAGTDFLSNVCVAWENATAPALEAGVRVVTPRLGIVLAKHGGALQRMLLPFQLGVGGPLGTGKQWWSWVTLEDVVRTFTFLLDSDVAGPVNVVAPEPVTNREFARTLGRVMHRPAVFPLPAFVAKVILGEMAEPLLLYSQRVDPVKLQTADFQFEDPSLESALATILKKG